MTIQNTNLATVTAAMNETKISVRQQLAKEFAAELSAKLKALKGASLLG